MNFVSANHIFGLMKRGTFSIWFVCGLAFSAGLHAADEALPDDPYAPIVARNIFGLNPPKPVDTKPPDITPPAKITPNGIMTIFGKKQVLFKVVNPPERGKPAKEASYILSEGQRQDDVEVTHIDEANGIITFNNHGIVQEIPLASAPALNMPVAAARPGSIPAPVLPRPVVGNANGVGENFSRIGNRPGINRGSINNGNFNNGSGGNISVNSSSSGSSTAPTQPQITPEEQIIEMEVNREATADQVKDGELPPLPPTPLTPPGAPGYVPPSQGEQQ